MSDLDQGQENLKKHGCNINVIINCGDDDKNVIDECCEPEPDHHHDQCCKPEFAEFFSTSSQTLAPSLGANQPGQSVLLENLVYSTSGIDGSMVGANGQITINVSGWYDVAAGMTGALNPIPAPLPVWTLSLFKNGIIVPGSTFSNVPLSPAQSSNEITADSFVHFMKGDILILANTSNVQVFLSAPVLGTYAQTNSAYLKLQLLEADQTSGNPLVDAANASFVAAQQAAQLAYNSATAVNLSQLASDALIAQTDANNLVAMLNLANAALLAAVGVSTPASYAAATAAWNAAMASAALSVVAANLVVGSLTPTNTAALVAQATISNNTATTLAGSKLVKM